jgi:regulator of sigma E protease
LGILLAIILFGFIVFFHELGHFSVAKKNGIEVEEFCLGMGPVLFSKEYKGTRYALRLFPIGGACMMGEDDEATGSDGNFHSKSVWARMAVIAAGPVFNFILAFVMAVILTGLAGYDRPVISDVEEGFPAIEAGLQAGDEIVKIDNKRIHIFREISMYNQFHQGEKMELTYLRDGVKYRTTLEPKFDDELQYYRMGILSSGYEEANLLTSVQYGAYEVKYWIDYTLASLKMLITGQVGVDQLSGPVGIVNLVDDTYEASVSYGVVTVVANMLNLAILLSANLGVFNLLPFPALDGGRLVFLIIEAIRGKKIPPEKEGYFHFAGFALLMILMVIVLFNDVMRIFS